MKREVGDCGHETSDLPVRPGEDVVAVRCRAGEALEVRRLSEVTGGIPSGEGA